MVKAILDAEKVQRVISYLIPIAESSTVGTYGDNLKLAIEALEKQSPQKIVFMETTTKFKNSYGYHPAYGHCPVCGRIYWDKCHVGKYCDQCGQRLEDENG